MLSLYGLKKNCEAFMRRESFLAIWLRLAFKGFLLLIFLFIAFAFYAMTHRDNHRSLHSTPAVRSAFSSVRST